ncbi:MAG: winged helix-turn-helix transcriptional regulator [Xanthomonadales bacterium]|nr:winged helix-turn-helix transcriptional regulator [Xanthomonadales bacterium]NIN60081.1 winged helix-turn-helix transcriptional regulator [Xanthomonadales bacterium]NIN75451.1 winged helix-turn-helix transcriptional regulator [Xanthomonadales bacterium]NIO13547.1 winged helix-turn-helix transcriptional regulator [Xanthomonadales bacterium]NIP12474.1 winged helix-turn-helix transcriptional regulator [Xanthomonadales bacterium]
MPEPKQGRKPLDRTDRRILECLQAEGRISNVALARKVNLTPTPCLERVKRLERDGYIRGYTALLDPELVDAGLLVFVEIDLTRTSPDVFRDFRREASQLPQVLDCHLVSGNFDYLIKARVRDMQEYRELLGEKILSLPGVNGSRSYVVMEQVKETTHLPLFK